MKRFLAGLFILSVLSVPCLAAKTNFVDGDKATKTPGTIVTAAWLNATNNHRHDGLAADGSGALDYAVASGTANHLTATLPKALPALITGMPIQIKAVFSNSSAATLAVDSTGSKAIQKLGGTALAAGDIQANQILQLAYDGAVFQLLSYNSPPVTNAVTLQGQTPAMLVPPGAIMDFGAPTVPAGWLACDGRAVLRAQYSALFAYIGTTWGAGDNVSTFNLPDFRAEFRRGWDNGRGVDADRAFGSFQADSLKTHIHTWTYPYSNGNDGETVDQLAIAAGNLGSLPDIPTAATGGTETRPRNIAVLTCIKY